MPNLVVLTGAGISAESGIQTFRDSMGLWEQHKVEDVATPDGFAKNPSLVHEFYNQRRRQVGMVEPNAAHYALAKLEAAWTDGFLLITQNIDNLHERAGSTNVSHIHGEICKLRCVHCGERMITMEDSTPESVCPSCYTIGSLRPDVVWFGEMPYHLDRIEKVLEMTDIFISIGTSGNVMPASLFPSVVLVNNRVQKDIIEINPVPTGDTAFTRVITKKASEGVPELVDELFSQYSLA